jgi:hypothetical protein
VRPTAGAIEPDGSGSELGGVPGSLGRVGSLPGAAAPLSGVHRTRSRLVAGRVIPRYQSTENAIASLVTEWDLSHTAEWFRENL